MDKEEYFCKFFDFIYGENDLDFKKNESGEKEGASSNKSNPSSSRRSQGCTFCKKELKGFPYSCKFCGLLFCGKHRLPESHACVSKYRTNELKSTCLELARKNLVEDNLNQVTWEDVLEILSKLVSKYGEKDWRLFTLYEIDGSDVEALKFASRRIISDPVSSSAEFLFKLGRVCHKARMFEETQTFYETSIRKDPKFIPAFNNLGLLFKENGNLDDAEAIFRDAITSNPNNIVIWVNLGIILEERGKKEEAIATYEKGLELFPSNFMLWKMLERLNTREYYIKVHGFDIIAERQNLPWDPQGFRYEVLFELDSDLLFKDAGIVIGARVDTGKPNPLGDWITQLESGSKPRNRIVFKRAGKESLVKCVHTAIFQFPSEGKTMGDWDEKALLEYSRSTEHKEIDLTPEEHFVSLKSFVAGIAEEGIQNMMLASYLSEEVNPFTLPFGFNEHLQGQIIRSLRQLAPEITSGLLHDHLIAIAKKVPANWFVSRLPLFAQMYFQPTIEEETLPDLLTLIERQREPLTKLYDFIFGDEEYFKILDDILKSEDFRRIKFRYRRENSRNP